MRELNVCLKLNFLSKKIPVLIGTILLCILFVETKRNNIYISIDKIYTLESLFFIIYSAYNYKNSFAHWINIGGRRKDFYLSSFIFYIFTAAVISYIQTLVFIHYVSQMQIFNGPYDKLNLLQVVSFTPLELWFYQFLGFMCSACAGALIGVLNIRHDLGEALAMSFGYFSGSVMLYFFLIKIFGDDLPNFIMNQATIYLYQIIIYAISVYIGWRIIRREEDLCID
ncbi:hypothetical protein [Clostridium aciditolerans]|uniref:Uncharacterized protein n=1 Tax=Clostridium aciditolerans TaxID=339861 RepID=A0A934HWR0_9CLOT|nr:hypothetical protein [Clostridium aciditolerans]MBI6872377.1 hypothetical protein [Clostridium aciditolerans]